MDSREAYDSLKQWAAQFRHLLTDAVGPVSRAEELAGAVAALRLSKTFPPSEPDRLALRTLMLDYLQALGDPVASGGNEEWKIGNALENLISQAAARQVHRSENQPYFGCHKTQDSRPPLSHKPPL